MLFFLTDSPDHERERHSDQYCIALAHIGHRVADRKYQPTEIYGMTNPSKGTLADDAAVGGQYTEAAAHVDARDLCQHYAEQFEDEPGRRKRAGGRIGGTHEAWEDQHAAGCGERTRIYGRAARGESCERHDGHDRCSCDPYNIRGTSQRKAEFTASRYHREQERQGEHAIAKGTP